MRNIFAIFFAAILYSSTLFAADSDTITLEGEPHSSFLVWSTLYVISESRDYMYRINTSTNKFLSRIKLDSGPTLGITHNDKMYILNSEDRTVSVYYNTNAFKTLSVVGSWPLGIVPIGTRLYVASFDDTLTIIDAIGDWRIDQIVLQSGGTPTRHMTVLGNRIFLHHPATNSVSVFTTSGNKILKNFIVGTSPQSSVLNGKSLYVINRDSNDVTVVNTDTYAITKTISLGTWPTTGVLVGKKMYINNTIGNSVSVIDTTTNTLKIDIPVGKNPVSLLAKEKLVYVINHDDNSVSVIDTETDKVLHTFVTGLKPLSGTFAGNNLYINNSGEKTISYFYALPPFPITVAPVVEKNMCSEASWYRLCSSALTPTSEKKREQLVCEWIIDPTRTSDRFISHFEVLDMAVRLSRKSISPASSYQDSFTDIVLSPQTISVVRIVQTALDHKLFFIRWKKFWKDDPVRRHQVYSYFMKSVCIPFPVTSGSYIRQTYQAAYDAGLFTKSWRKFRPNSKMNRESVYSLAQEIISWADKNGGCDVLMCRAR